MATRFRKTFCAGEMSDEARSSYSVQGHVCNERLQGLLRKAFCREVSKRLWAHTAPDDNSPRPLRFSVDDIERPTRDLVWHSLVFEVGRDQHVASSSFGKERCAADGEPIIIDETRTACACDRLAHEARCDAPIG